MIYFIAYILLTSSGLLLMKLGIDGTAFSQDSGLLMMSINIKLILGFLFYVCSFLIYVLVLQRKDLSFIYPICSGIVNVASVAMGALILHEKVGGRSIVGAMLIVAGVVIMNLK